MNTTTAKEFISKRGEWDLQQLSLMQHCELATRLIQEVAGFVDANDDAAYFANYYNDASEVRHGGVLYEMLERVVDGLYGRDGVDKDIISDLDEIGDSIMCNFYNDFRCDKCDKWINVTTNIDNYYPYDGENFCEDCLHSKIVDREGWYCAFDGDLLDKSTMMWHINNHCAGCPNCGQCEKDAFLDYARDQLDSISGAASALANEESSEHSRVSELVELFERPTPTPFFALWFEDQDKCREMAKLSPDEGYAEWCDYCVNACGRAIDTIVNKEV